MSLESFATDSVWLGKIEELLVELIALLKARIEGMSEFDGMMADKLGSVSFRQSPERVPSLEEERRTFRLR